MKHRAKERGGTTHACLGSCKEGKAFYRTV